MAVRTSLFDELSCPTAGEDIYDFVREIFPICRSITGDGVRETLRALSRLAPLDIHEVASGTQAFDWTVPSEWNIRAAHIRHSDGRKVVDFADSSLHVMSYSVPVRARMSLQELRPHIHTLPDQPERIPYHTSYYAERWGFCMPHALLESLPDGDYDVLIDATLAPGHLTYGEYLHRGESDHEILFSAHVCHPSLANDNCSGLGILGYLASRLRGRKTRYSYRFLFAPGTIGAITWLSRNAHAVQRIRHGLVVSCLGDAGAPTYKRSRRGDAEIDRVLEMVIGAQFPKGRIIDFSPYGYDERQFCSPGFNLPVGLLQRSLHGTFPEYHTSGDNLDFISAEQLGVSYALILRAIDVLEANVVYRSTNPYGEPQLGRHGLYSALGNDRSSAARSMAMLWVLNLADGRHSLLDMARRSGLAFADVRAMAEVLVDHGLLVPDPLSP